MRNKTLLILVVLSSLLLLTFACSKKKMVKSEPAPPVEEVQTDIPPVEEEKPITEPAVKPAPVLEDVYFAFDKFGLTEESKRTLERNAKELKAYPSAVIVIEGHCDERGTVEYNMALGEKRAKAAMSYLTSLGVKAGSIEVVSFGKSRPFDPGHTEDAWAKNRRAHFINKR
ncbi:MAG: peptidoglycan-associated lipoprotein Pal [Candidatus Latescibacterota bacterium]